jgi:hypothetical protein
MTNFEPIEDNPKISYLFFSIIVGCVFTGVGVTHLNNALPLLATLIIIGIILLGVINFYNLSQLHNLTLQKDRLEIKSFFGRSKSELLIADIESYTEIEQRNKTQKWKELTLYTASDSYIISSDVYEKYDPLKQYIIRGKKYNTGKQTSFNKRKNLQQIVIPAIMAIGFVIYWVVMPQQNDNMLVAAAVLAIIASYKLLFK